MQNTKSKKKNNKIGFRYIHYENLFEFHKHGAEC